MALSGIISFVFLVQIYIHYYNYLLQAVRFFLDFKQLKLKKKQKVALNRK